MAEKETTAHPRLSARLSALANMVTPGHRLADIGTDHALIPVSLLLKQRIPFAYACDIGAGPLARAEAHIHAYGLEARTALRLSDGLKGLRPGEADTVLISGMGGELMIRILEEGAFKRSGFPKLQSLYDSANEWIFSPHTAWVLFRVYLKTHGFCIQREQLLCEEDKYYLILKAVRGDGEKPYLATRKYGIPDAVAERFGPVLLAERDPVLLRFITHEIKKENTILTQLGTASGSAVSHKQKKLVQSITAMERLSTFLQMAEA